MQIFAFRIKFRKKYHRTMSKIDKRFAKGASYDFDSMEYDEGQVNLSRVSA